METAEVDGDALVDAKIPERKSLQADGGRPDQQSAAEISTGPQESNYEDFILDRVIDLLNDLIMTFSVVLVGCQIHRWYSGK